MLEPPVDEAVLDTLCQWDNSLKVFRQRLGQFFPRAEPRQAAWDYLQALLGCVDRKNGWQLAEQAGDANPYRFQHLLGRAQWSAKDLCGEVRDYAVEHLDDGAAILAVDETCFLKKGQQSVGVQQQYCSLTGQIENCQVGVFLAYISTKGHSLIDRRLYLPESWTGDRDRCEQAKVPEQTQFATKGQLAKQMLESLLGDGVRPAWFVADEVYSRDGSFWWWLERTAHQPYVLTIPQNQSTPINYKTVYARDLVATISNEDWQRLSCGAGSKGEREDDWARVELSCRHPEGFSRWFLFRRSCEDPTCISYYQAFAPRETSLATLVWVAGQRWRIEECFQLAKGELGLGDYEVRSWTGWHRHTALVMAAQACLTVLRSQVEPAPTSASSPFLRQPSRVASLTAFRVSRGL